MPEVIAGFEIPETEATGFIEELTSPLIYHHSRRVFSPAAAETVWAAIALHTTPGIPGRMAPEIALTQLGVLTDVLGLGLAELDRDQVAEIVAAHPRGDFKNEFPQAQFDGQKNRPETTNGTVNSDVLEHFIPGFQRTTMVERIVASPRPS